MSADMFRTPAKRLVAAALVACAVLAGCATATDAPHVSILGPWPEGGAEAEQFHAALAAFERENHLKVDYTGSSAVAQVLQSEVQQGTPPDIAVLPSPGDVARYQHELTPLDVATRKKPNGIVGPSWTREYSRQWQQLARVGLPRLYAVPIKANLKGLVWFNRNHPPDPVPRTFAELSTLSGTLVAAGQTPWCLGVAGQTTSGWPGTDWIEDILLKQSGVDSYQQWVAGRLPWRSAQVRSAWTTWGDLVTGPGQVLGGPKAALLTDFSDAARPMFAARPGCLMEHQASFMSGFYAGYDQKPVPGKDFDFFPLPPVEAGTNAAAARPVSADLAGMFNDSPPAEALVSFLVSRSAQEEWPAVRAFSANKQVPATGYDALGKRVAADLTGPAPLCFDGSDLMPVIMRGAFYRAVLEYLADPSGLDTVLTELDQVRTGLAEDQWLTTACAR
jgi:alpha-glucoside transport system substrate-binding protein